MDICILCLENLPKKNRRNVFSETFTVKKQLAEVLGAMPDSARQHPSYTCFPCFNKLNKLSKIYFDLENKLENLKRERLQLLCQLRSKIITNQPAQLKTPSLPIPDPIGATGTDLADTPRKLSKRIIIRTPTPRKTKAIHSSSASTSVRKRLADSQLTPSKVKVSKGVLFITVFGLIQRKPEIGCTIMIIVLSM